MGQIFGGGGQSGANNLNDVAKNQIAQQNLLDSNVEAINPQNQQFGQALAAGAAGAGPSIADAQMKLAMQQSLQSQLASAQAQRGVNPALAGRNAQQAAAQTNLGIAGTGAANRLQEQQNQENQFQTYLSNTNNAATNSGNAASTTAAAQAKSMAGQNNVLGGLLSTAGTIVGGIYGGPAGAALGGAAGSALGGGSSAGSGDAYDASTPANTGVVSGGGLNFTDNSAAIGSPKAHGGLIKGPEMVKGDSAQNDVIMTPSSAGEIMVPKSVVAQGGKAAGKFVDALLEHEAQKEKIKKMTYGDVLAAKKGR